MRRRAAHLLAAAAVAAALALPVAGCKTTGDDVTGSIGCAPRSEADWRGELYALGARYRANPGDAQAAMDYAPARHRTARPGGRRAATSLYPG
jgi:hypothetical protein